ncbi:hypothetical protein [Granulicella arctica]|uniref:hypothetical protein n=1 Tax=Granulicella arctica TaxID=940613 RepID=UPI0021DF4716|nr:hypothetical protein [Granulicella arctica]
MRTAGPWNSMVPSSSPLRAGIGYLLFGIVTVAYGQPVTLTLTGGLKLGDAHVNTSFAHNDTTQSSVEIEVPVKNQTTQPIRATLNATIEDVRIHESVVVPPGESEIRLTPANFPQLVMQHPRLWWPNGYGAPALYKLGLSLGVAGEKTPSDTKDIRFGVQEISYELSLLDQAGHLRRVEFSPTEGRAAKAPIVDVRHEGMRERLPRPTQQRSSSPKNAANAITRMSPPSLQQVRTLCDPVD